MRLESSLFIMVVSKGTAIIDGGVTDRFMFKVLSFGVSFHIIEYFALAREVVVIWNN